MAIIGGEARREAVIDTITRTAIGGVIGGVVGTFIITPHARRYPGPLPPHSRAFFACAYALEGSALCAAWFGTKSIVRGIRDKDDLTSRLVSGSGAGLVYYLLSQAFKPKHPKGALVSSATFAVVSGISYKVSERKKTRIAQDAFYTEARAMLTKLGLEKYEKNFKKGHFTDCTLPLLTDSDLREVNIPAGPRLLILDHIKRYNKMVNRK